MFEVSIATCIICLALYAVLRTAIIPTVLRKFKFRGQWAIEYFEKHVSPHEQQHHAQIVVCFLHAIIAWQGSFRALMQYPQTLQTYEEQIVAWDSAAFQKQLTDDPLRSFYLEFTLGYFVADTIIYFMYLTKYPLLDIVHHLVSIVSFYVGLSTGVGNFGMLCLQTNEVSTPFLHLRYIMTQWDLKKHWLYELNQVVFVILFFFGRVIYDSFVTYASIHGLFTRECHAPLWAQIFQIFCCTLFTVVQWIWFIKIVAIVKAKFSTGSKQAVKQE